MAHWVHLILRAVSYILRRFIAQINLWETAWVKFSYNLLSILPR